MMARGVRGVRDMTSKETRMRRRLPWKDDSVGRVSWGGVACLKTHLGPAHINPSPREWRPDLPKVSPR